MKKSKGIIPFILSVMLLSGAFAFALTGCGGTPPPAKDAEGYDRDGLKADFLSKADEVTVTDTSVTFTDASGKGSITVAKNPQRVINLYASFTTLWYEAGGTVYGLIGGASSSTLYEEQIGRDVSKDDGVVTVAASSSGSGWNVESILSHSPDLIICSTAMSGYAKISAPAEALSVPVIAVEYDDFSDYLKWYKVFCNISGHAELWDSVAVDALEEVTDILMKAPLENNPVIFSMFSGSTSLQANLEGTVMGAMAKQLRAKNIADSWFNPDSGSRLPINLESVYLGDPDMILIQCHSEGDAVTEIVDALYGTDPVWNALRAVKDGKVYYMQKTLFHNKPNRKFAEAYKIMAEHLYPDVDFGE
ncbi:MAG: ABC transporter substrate-binding protein [Clostridiales bacterium]|jgi:ABC-type Fe3+-hydroxamate transport system substrate-binding protein|nr:ABC transporter substrate-binding protein [Clostridiales bacterium]